MNARDRFLATAGFHPVDRTFLIPPWMWKETRSRWDMAGKGGPLGSPAMYREFCLEPLKRVTGLRPFEIASACDPVATHRKYGKNLIIQGGIDKRVLAKDQAAIEREVLCKVPWLCMQGGYFPQVDHLVPPDVSLENYTYYSQLLRAVVEDPERYLDEARKKGFWKD